eukprot:31349-Pelagococcus_subviridis.AAC.17
MLFLSLLDVVTATGGRAGGRSTRRSFSGAIVSSHTSKTRARRARRFRRRISPSSIATFRMTFWSPFKLRQFTLIQGLKGVVQYTLDMIVNFRKYESTRTSTSGSSCVLSKYEGTFVHVTLINV